MNVENRAEVRKLLDSGRCQPSSSRWRSPDVLARATELRADGLTYEQLAQRVDGDGEHDRDRLRS